MPVDPADIYAGYQRATRVAPVDRSVVETALQPYKITIPSLKGMTDQQLRRKAALAVISRYRAAKAAAFDAARPPYSTHNDPLVP